MTSSNHHIQVPEELFPGSFDITESGTVYASPERPGNYTAHIFAVNLLGTASTAQTGLLMAYDAVVVKKWEFEVVVSDQIMKQL